MSYDTKIESAREAVESHNSNVSDEFKIGFEDFLSKLQGSGGTSEAALAACKYEDLEKCGLPSILARLVANTFRKKNGEGSDKSSYVSNKKAEMMTPKELLERYNPKDIKNAVGKRLKEITGGKRCIVFSDDGTVNVEESVKMIQALADGYDEVDTVTVEGKPRPVYKVGSYEDNFVNLDPIENQPLRPGDICSKTGRSWEKIPLNIRQLVYIANHITQELRINGVDGIHDVVDQAEKEGAEMYFRNRYRGASLKFDELEGMGNLPILKIKLGGSSRAIDKKNDPFYSNKTY